MIYMKYLQKYWKQELIMSHLMEVKKKVKHEALKAVTEWV